MKASQQCSAEGHSARATEVKPPQEPPRAAVGGAPLPRRARGRADAVGARWVPRWCRRRAPRNARIRQPRTMYSLLACAHYAQLGRRAPYWDWNCCSNVRTAGCMVPRRLHTVPGEFRKVLKNSNSKICSNKIRIRRFFLTFQDQETCSS